MNALQEVAREGLIEQFLGRAGLVRGRPVQMLETPTEEITDGFTRKGEALIYTMPAAGRRPRAAGGGQTQRLVRKEENYIWSTRRWPSNPTSDTLAPGTIARGDYHYFSSGVGDPGSTLGYFSTSTLTHHQTNMDKGGKVPTGRGFAMYELACSFNASALPQDIAQLMDNLELRYSKNNDDFTLHHGPLKLWPGGTGISGFASIGAGSGLPGPQALASNGVPTTAAVRRFKHPRVLSANESFAYIVNASDKRWASGVAITLSAFTELTLWLYGYHFVRVTG